MHRTLLVLLLTFCTLCCASSVQRTRDLTESNDAATARRVAAVAAENERKLTTDDLSKMSATAAAKAAKIQEADEQNRKDALADFKTGAGLGISIVLGGAGDDVIEDAKVVNDRIVVTKSATDQPRAALEAHQLFTGNPFTASGRQTMRDQLEACGRSSIDCPMFGIGPFAALQTGDDNSISSAGFGIMLGLRSDPRRDSSFNIGVGLVWDTRIKTLAEGFEEGEPLPTGATEIQFAEKSARRLMITLSFAF
jgi:hypothetical protein